MCRKYLKAVTLTKHNAKLCAESISAGFTIIKNNSDNMNVTLRNELASLKNSLQIEIGQRSKYNNIIEKSLLINKKIRESQSKLSNLIDKFVSDTVEEHTIHSNELKKTLRDVTKNVTDCCLVFEKKKIISFSKDLLANSISSIKNTTTLFLQNYLASFCKTKNGIDY